MDTKRRKQLLEEYKNRRPEMGVISFRCKETDDVFLGASTDTKAGFNSNCAKLSMHSHPNRQLQALWNQYGRKGFVLSVVEVLKYENPADDHSKELEALCERHLAHNKQARRIWR